jgi:hypothetical protein
VRARLRRWRWHWQRAARLFLGPAEARRPERPERPVRLHVARRLPGSDHRKLAARIAHLKQQGDRDEAAAKEIRDLRLRIAHSQAVRIQAACRGYWQRKPLSIVLSDYRNYRVAVVLDLLLRQRHAAGRPGELDAMSAEHLKAEKHSIKLILVSFDKVFQRKHGRLVRARARALVTLWAAGARPSPF